MNRGIPYSQIEVANVNSNATREEVEAYCKEECVKRSGCTGFFHRNSDTFKFCGLYWDDLPGDDMMTYPEGTEGIVCKRDCNPEMLLGRVRTSDRKCSVVTPCMKGAVNEYAEFEIFAPEHGYNGDYVCKQTSDKCDFDTQFESTLPTDTSDRQCTDLSLCSAQTQFIHEPKTLQSDRKCKSRTDCKQLSPQHYEHIEAQKGFCVDARGRDVNSGIFKHEDPDLARGECLAWCAGQFSQSTKDVATGCEHIVNRGNRGCYVFVSTEIHHGNGRSDHECWIFTRQEPEMVDTDCRLVTECAPDEEFQVVAATDKTNNVCNAITDCDLETHWTSAKYTAVSDNRCTLLSVCDTKGDPNEGQPCCQDYKLTTNAGMFNDRICTRIDDCEVGGPAFQKAQACRDSGHGKCEDDGFQAVNCDCERGWSGEICDCQQYTTYSAAANAESLGKLVSPCMPYLPCSYEEYMVGDPSLYSQHECETLRVCTENEYMSRAEDRQDFEKYKIIDVAINDRECTQYSDECSKQEFGEDKKETVQKTATSDRECGWIDDCEEEAGKCIHDWQGDLPTPHSCEDWSVYASKNSLEPAAGVRCECASNAGYTGRYCDCKEGVTFKLPRDDNCHVYRECDNVTEYEFVAPTKTSDRQCNAHPICEDNEFEAVAATAKSSRVCQEVRPPCDSATEFEKTAPTSTNDRECDHTTTTSTSTSTSTTTSTIACDLDCGDYGTCVLTRPSGQCDDDVIYSEPRCECQTVFDGGIPAKVVGRAEYPEIPAREFCSYGSVETYQSEAFCANGQLGCSNATGTWIHTRHCAHLVPVEELGIPETQMRLDVDGKTGFDENGKRLTVTVRPTLPNQKKTYACNIPTYKKKVYNYDAYVKGSCGEKCNLFRCTAEDVLANLEGRQPEQIQGCEMEGWQYYNQKMRQPFGKSLKTKKWFLSKYQVGQKLHTNLENARAEEAKKWEAKFFYNEVFNPGKNYAVKSYSTTNPYGIEWLEDHTKEAVLNHCNDFTKVAIEDSSEWEYLCTRRYAETKDLANGTDCAIEVNVPGKVNVPEKDVMRCDKDQSYWWKEVAKKPEQEGGSKESEVQALLAFDVFDRLENARYMSQRKIDPETGVETNTYDDEFAKIQWTKYEEMKARLDNDQRTDVTCGSGDSGMNQCAPCVNPDEECIMLSSTFQRDANGGVPATMIDSIEFRCVSAYTSAGQFVWGTKKLMPELEAWIADQSATGEASTGTNAATAGKKSAGALGGVAAALGVAALLVAVVMQRRGKPHTKDGEDDADESKSVGSAVGKLTPYASGIVPAAGLTARGDRLWLDFRLCTGFDYIYFGNDLFKLTDPALEDVYALLQVACPPRTYFAPLRDVASQFLDQRVSRQSLTEAASSAEEDAIDFVSEPMAEFLVERAIDLLAILKATDHQIDESVYEAFYEMVSKYEPSQNGFLSQSFGGAGGMGMRPDAATRSLVQAEPLYYEAENDYAAINKALYEKAGGGVYDGLYDSATGEGPGGLYDSATASGDVLYDAANDGQGSGAGASRYDRVSAGGMYDRAEPDVTYNTAMPSRDKNGAGYARATSGTSLYDQLQEEQALEPAYSRATAPGAAQSGYAMATTEPMYDAAEPLSGSVATGYSLAAAGDVGRANGYSLAAAGDAIGAQTGSGYALASAGGATYDNPATQKMVAKSRRSSEV
jgi:hypothetical protein